MSDQRRSQPTARSDTCPARDPSLARSAFRRGARLASLPLGFAGRATLGLGKRLGRDAGRAGERAAAAAGSRAALPGSGRAQGRRDEVRPGAEPVRVGAAGGGRGTVSGAPGPAAGCRTADADLQGARRARPRARLGLARLVRPISTRCRRRQHRSARCTGRPGPTAVRSRSRCSIRVPTRRFARICKQIGRLSKVFAPLAGGMDVEPLVDELTARVSEELDYTLEAASQQQAADGFAGSEEFYVPAVLASTPRVMVSEWVDGVPLSSAAATCPTTSATQPLCSTCASCSPGPSVVGLLHADPHPGNFKLMQDGRLGVVDFGLVARLPDGLPAAMGRILRIAQQGDAHQVAEGLRQEGFLASDDRRRGSARLSGPVRGAGRSAGVPVQSRLDAGAVHPGTRPSCLGRRSDETEPAAELSADPSGLAGRPGRAVPAQCPGSVRRGARGVSARLRRGV